nr:hypothetical protein K-LCC10_0463 [Kaumoebavirus]
MDSRTIIAFVPLTITSFLVAALYRSSIRQINEERNRLEKYRMAKYFKRFFFT